jgi:hypothetical protein
MWTVLPAVACVAAGWFFMSSLITDYGAVQLRFRFYNMLTLMHTPRRITTGASGEGTTLDAVLFGTVCAAAVVVALAPVWSTRKAAWLGCVAPLALMALTGAVLYHGFSQDLVANDGMLGDSGLRLSHFANELANRVSAAITRRIHVGVGGYLSLAASGRERRPGRAGPARLPQGRLTCSGTHASSVRLSPSHSVRAAPPPRS